MNLNLDLIIRNIFIVNMRELRELAKGDKGEDADELKIATWVLSQIPVPKDGKDADEEKVIRQVLAKLPPFPNENDIVKKVLKLIPENKASLKVIQEKLEIDKDALLDEILKSPRLKLKIDNVDGLKGTLDLLDRRYIHGGGFSNIANASGTVAAGLDTLKFTGSGVNSVTKTGSTVTVNISGGSGGNPGGNTTDIQFNDSGSFGGNDKFAWDNSSETFITPNVQAYNTDGLSLKNSAGSVVATAGNGNSLDFAISGNVTGSNLSGTNTGDQQFQTNGTPNPTQSTLNLVAGTNITLTSIS